MSAASFFLRLALSVLLVLNGSSGSAAATEMAAAQAPSRAHASEAKQPPNPRHAAHACHDHASAAGKHEAKPASKVLKRHADCCGAGLCGCACAQIPSLAALNLQPASTVGRLHGRVDSAVSSLRPAPALPHLIRPPIA